MTINIFDSMSLPDCEEFAAALQHLAGLMDCAIPSLMDSPEVHWSTKKDFVVATSDILELSEKAGMQLSKKRASCDVPPRSKIEKDDEHFWF